MTNPDDALASAFRAEMGGEAEQQPTAEEPKNDEAPIATDVTEGEAEETEELEDAEDEVAEEGDGETDEVHTVKLDGEELKVTLPELKAGYMKDADYRRKTSELASQRKAIEEDAKRFDSGFDALVKQLTVADQIVRESFLSLTDEDKDRLAVENPQEYVRIQRIEEKAQHKLRLLSEQFQQAQAVRQEHLKAATEKHRKAEREALAQERPEFRKPEAWDRLYSYLKGDQLGFTQEVLETVTDRRFVIIADKARRYDALMAKGEDRKVKVAPKLQKANGVQRAVQSNAGVEAFQRGVAEVKGGNKDALTKLMAYL